MANAAVSLCRRQDKPATVCEMCWYMPVSARARGFTLIEVLVALFVMAVLTAMSWRGIDAMVQAQQSVKDSGHDTAALQAGLLQWRADLDAMMVWPVARQGARQGAAERAEIARRSRQSLYWDGRALRVTRSDSGGQGVRVVAWTRASMDGHWLRWQSAPLKTAPDWRAAWQAAGEWARSPVAPLPEDADASAVLIARADDWQIHYYRRNAWSNALSADAPQADEEHTSLPDAVRLRLVLAPEQPVSGEITVDWVRPSFGGLQ